MAGYIPNSDADFQVWLANFVNALASVQTQLGLTNAQINNATNAASQFQTAYAASVAAQTTAASAVQNKDLNRRDAETAVRSLVAQIQALPATTDDVRAQLGITIRSSAHSHIETLLTTPVLNVDMGTRLVHIVEFADSGTPTSKAKPAGVMGCELWQKVGGPAPVTNDGMTFLAVDTRTPYVAHFDATAVGQMVYYIGRWVTSKGEQGPWSTVIGATVGG